MAMQLVNATGASSRRRLVVPLVCWLAAAGVTLGFLPHRAAAQAPPSTSTFTIVTDQSDYTALPSLPGAPETVTVTFKLRETFTGSTAYFDTATNRLIAFGLDLERGNTVPTALSPASIMSVVPSSNFGQDFSDYQPTDPITGEPTGPPYGDHARIEGLRGSGVAPITSPAPNVREVLLGTATIQTGTIVGSQTTFSVLDFQGSDDFVNPTPPDGFSLDPYINVIGTPPAADFNSKFRTTFTVTVVPEPSTGLALAAVVGMLLVRRRRTAKTV